MILKKNFNEQPRVTCNMFFILSSFKSPNLITDGSYLPYSVSGDTSFKEVHLIPRILSLPLSREEDRGNEIEDVRASDVFALPYCAHKFMLQCILDFRALLRVTPSVSTGGREWLQ